MKLVTIPLYRDLSSLFHLNTARYIKGLFILFLVSKNVLHHHHCPEKTPIQSMGSCSLFHLAFKTSFLIAITLAKRVGELGASMAKPWYTVFYHNKMSLRPHARFLPKVSMEFHINQDINLLVFYPKPHSLRKEASISIH